MVVHVNGEDMETRAATVSALLGERGVDSTLRGLAVALNGTLVPRPTWTETRLQPGDAVEIVRPFAGG